MAMIVPANRFARQGKCDGLDHFTRDFRVVTFVRLIQRAGAE
jgi:hypothetical protein